MAHADSHPRYSASGFFRPTVFVLFAIAAAVAVLGAALYQLIVGWVPFIYLNALVAVGLGFLIGGAATLMVSMGHCRNRGLALLLTLPLGLAAVAASHFVAYRRALSEITEEVKKDNPEVTREQVAEEITFQKYVDMRKEVGWKLSRHGSGGLPINGVFVWIIWAIEAGIFLVIAMFMASSAAAEPYCERCNQWCEDKTFAIGGIDKQRADAVLSGGDLSEFATLEPPPEPTDAVALSVTLALCGTCRDTGFLSLEEVRIVQKKGKSETEKSTIVEHLTLRVDQREKLATRQARIQAEVAQPIAS